MKRPTNRKSFKYALYCDLVCEAKQGVRKKQAIMNVAVRRGIQRKWVQGVWIRFVRPNMIETQGRASELF